MRLTFRNEPEGGSWEMRVSLLSVGNWIRSLSHQGPNDFRDAVALPKRVYPPADCPALNTSPDPEGSKGSQETYRGRPGKGWQPTCHDAGAETFCCAGEDTGGDECGTCEFQYGLGGVASSHVIRIS